jgi:molybdenum-dependent DNA-binding transcriptional regulator ModE
VADPDLLALRSEISVIDSRLCELLETIGTSGSVETWEEMRETIEQRRKLVDSERGRLRDLGAMISAERAMLLIRALTASIKRHVTDRDALAAISREFGAVVGSSSGRGPEST